MIFFELSMKRQATFKRCPTLLDYCHLCFIWWSPLLLSSLYTLQHPLPQHHRQTGQQRLQGWVGYVLCSMHKASPSWGRRCFLWSRAQGIRRILIHLVQLHSCPLFLLDQNTSEAGIERSGPPSEDSMCPESQKMSLLSGVNTMAPLLPQMSPVLLQPSPGCPLCSIPAEFLLMPLIYLLSVSHLQCPIQFSQQLRDVRR